MTQITPEPEITPPAPPPSPVPDLPETLPLAEEDLQALDEIFHGVEQDTDGMETIIVFE